jgi:hypothetical protein
MVAYVTQTAAGPWFWYKLDPADLAVNLDPEIEGGLTILWRGGTGLDRLKGFFEMAAGEVCRSEGRHYRASFMTKEGPQSLNFYAGQNLPIPEDCFVKFECFAAEPTSSERTTPPVFTVFANRDRGATSLDDLQESVGVSLKSTDLPLLQKPIAELVTGTASPFFHEHKAYDFSMVLEKLGEIQSETRVLLSR